jgi:glutaredoxin
MQIEIYTRQGCSKCVVLKEILQNKNVEYTEHEIDKTVSREEVVSKFPNVKMLPIVLVNSELSDSDTLVTLISENKV